jgi:hypothetical protein
MRKIHDEIVRSRERGEISAGKFPFIPAATFVATLIAKNYYLLPTLEPKYLIKQRSLTKNCRRKQVQGRKCFFHPIFE